MSTNIAIAMFSGFGAGFFLCFISYIGFRRSTKMTVVFPDGSWLKGIRKSKYVPQETHGTHHFYVTEVSEFMDKEIIGKRVAVPINSAKYFIVEEKV